MKKKKTQDMAAKQHVIKQWMGQQWDQGRNKEIPWNKWKWEHNNPKPVGHRKSKPKRDIHSIIDLSEKTRKSSNKQSNFTLKWTWKITTNKAKYESKERNNKDQSSNKWNRV